MSSQALAGLLVALNEVRDLQKANPTPPGGMPARPRVVRAINRSSVVLLTSHLERYVRALNEEAVQVINDLDIAGDRIPPVIRLRHSGAAVDQMLATQWDNRSDQLEAFARSDSWLWSEAQKGPLDPKRLLRWMKSPSPACVMRFFSMWGVNDVFSTITRTQQTRTRLWLKIDELVTKRNNIAHGDATTEATFQDIASYLAVVKTLCTRGDRALSAAVANNLGIQRPW